MKQQFLVRSGVQCCVAETFNSTSPAGDMFDGLSPATRMGLTVCVIDGVWIWTVCRYTVTGHFGRVGQACYVGFVDPVVTSHRSIRRN